MRRSLCKVRIWGVLGLLLTLVVVLAYAESVSIEGASHTAYIAGKSYPELIFDSNSSLPMQAWITVVRHVETPSLKTTISIDGRAPITVTDGATYGPAKSQIKVTSGYLQWEMVVQLNPSQGLDFDGVLEDSFSVPAGKKSGKILFEGQWNPWKNWVVVFVRVYKNVDFIDPSGEILWTLWPGDHVLSLSSIGKTFPLPPLMVRAGCSAKIGSCSILSAKMWKWK